MPEINEDRIYSILIVDDEKDVLESLRATLRLAKQFKSVISVAENGEAGMAELVKKNFDLVISDYKMPGMSGIDFLAKIKKSYPDTVRILITGYSDMNIAKEAINLAEVQYYLEKPWDNESLRSIISEVLKRKSGRDRKRINAGS